MYTVIGMNSICNPNLKHKGVQFLEVSRVYKHLHFTPVPLTNPKITFEVFKIWKQKTIFVVKSQMTQFFEDSPISKINKITYVKKYKPVKHRQSAPYLSSNFQKYLKSTFFFHANQAVRNLKSNLQIYFCRILYYRPHLFGLYIHQLSLQLNPLLSIVFLFF